MTTRLDLAVDAVRKRPPAEQDAIADAMLSMAGATFGEEIDPDEIEEAIRGLAQVDRGDVASDEQVEAAFARFRP